MNRASLLCCVGFLLMLASVGAVPLDLAGRTVLLDERIDGEEASAIIGLLRTQPDGVLQFAATDADLHEDACYAVFVGGDPERPAPRATVNGSTLVGDPFPVEGGWMFRIFPHALQTGENALRLASADGGPLAIDAVVVFSLVHTFEQVHFERTFGRRTAEKVQPAAHPDQAKFDVLHYKLDVVLDMNSRFLTGSVETTIKATADGLGQLVLDLDSNEGQLLPTAATLVPDGTPLSFSASDGRVFATLPSPIGIGQERTVRIAYSGTPTTRTHIRSIVAYAQRSIGGIPMIYTCGEPYGSRMWWPCKDLPDDKATAEILVTCPLQYEPVSNGSLLSVTDLGNGTHRWHWNEAYPITTYLISITCTDYIYGSGTYTGLDGTTTMEVGHYLLPSETDYLDEVPDTITQIEFFAETFGEYPFLDEKYVISTWGASGGFEHQTATNLSPGGIGTGFSPTSVHELAHQWFGNMVTTSHFDHVWLHEGWATYCEALFKEWQGGIGSYRSTVQGWNSSGISNTTPLVYPNADAFISNTIYYRGGTVLHMLRHVVGDEAFFEGARNYLSANAYGTAVTADFQEAMEAAHGGDLDWFFDQWVYGIGRPSYRWWWKSVAEDAIQVGIEQVGQQFFEMPIDMQLTLGGTGGFTATILNDANPQVFQIQHPPATVFNVQFDPDGWILKSSTQVAAPMLEGFEIR